MTGSNRASGALACTLALAACILSFVAVAQTFPSRPLTIVVGTAPGGPTDSLARLVQPKLATALGQAVVVENKPGASTYVGGEYVARSAPDGHTLLINATSALFPELFLKGIAVQQSKELVPVAPVGAAHFFFYGPASVPAKDMKEFVALVKANPKKYNLAAFPGAVLTLQQVVFLKQYGMDMPIVPYNSAANILTAMLRDEVHLYVGSINAIRGQIDAGKIRAFAKVGSTRSQALPDVPSTRELGLDTDMATLGDYVLLVPRQTPAGVIKTLNDNVMRVMEAPDVRDSLAKFGFDPLAEPLETTHKKFATLAASAPRWANDAGVAPQ
jgi:tripartite-type tricarboxylate transporter receptor subunit TctC